MMTLLTVVVIALAVWFTLAAASCVWFLVEMHKMNKEYEETEVRLKAALDPYERSDDE